MTDDSNRAPSRGTQVPSMEDIMTSIRRMIVNEPDSPAAPASPTTVPRPGDLPPLKHDEEITFSRFVRERAEALDEQRREPEAPRATREPGSTEVPGRTPVPMPDLPRARPEDESAWPTTPKPVEAGTEAFKSASSFLAIQSATAPKFEPLPPPTIVAATPLNAPGGASEPRAAEEASDGLLSSRAAEASRSAFARLAEAASPPTPPRPRAPSIEELAAEMLRPMLKEWLDANLPALVEKVVEQEVARLVKRTTG